MKAYKRNKQDERKLERAKVMATNTNQVLDNTQIRVPVWLGRIMLLITAAAWGGGYSFSAIAMEHEPMPWLMAVRLCVGALALGIVIHKRILRTPLSTITIPALILGITYWGAYELQMTGLQTTPPGRNSFLTATYCVMVPFILWVVTKHKPTIWNVIAGFICLFGVGLVSLADSSQGSSISTGDLISLAGGVMFGINIAMSGILAKQHDALTLTFYEFIIAGILFSIRAFFDVPVDTGALTNPAFIGSMLYLIVISTMIGQIFQNVAFACVPSAQGSLILCLESVFGVIFSVLITGETITTTSLIGFTLIFLAILLSEAPIRQFVEHFRK